MRLKAIFPNKDFALFPNQFVNARLLLNTRRDATVILSSAIQRGPKGTFVYVVKSDQTVSVRGITLGEVQEGEASVTAGLAPGNLWSWTVQTD